MNTPARLPRVVASDLDGTLLRSDGTLSQRTRDALRRVERAGSQFVIVTARPPRWVHELADLVGDHGVVICSNGAFVYDVRAREIIDERGLAAEVVRELAADLRTELPGIAFAVERRDGFGVEPHWVEPMLALPPTTEVARLEELLNPLPGKLLARHAVMDHHEFHQRVIEVIGERAVVAYSGAVGLAEINAVGVTKAVALADWCVSHQVGAEDVWAFGDMPNDVPMLSWAGTSYAVANGHPDAIDAADHRCPPNDEDGVAQVLELALGTDDQ